MGNALRPKKRVPSFRLSFRLLHALDWELLGHAASFLSFTDCVRTRRCCKMLYLESVRAPLSPARLDLAALDLAALTVTDGRLLRVLQLDQVARWANLRSLELGSCTRVSRELGLKLLAAYRNRRDFDFDFVWIDPCPKRAQDELVEAKSKFKSITIAGDGRTLGYLVRDAVLVASSFRIRWTVPDFAETRTSVRSPEFSFAGMRWQVSLYPRGNVRYTTKFVSVYLVNVSLEEAARQEQTCRGFRCFFEIAALNRDETQTVRKRLVNNSFTFGSWMGPGPFDRGYHELLSHEQLAAGFVVDGALSLEVVIKPACRCT
jgi:hypothetical protein